MNDAQALAEYGASDGYPPGDWRSWIVEITMSFEVDRVRLEAAQTKAIAGGKRAAVKKAAQRAKAHKTEVPE
jgi:hypothetical protein